MVRHELLAIRDGEAVVLQDFCEQWDLACHEFAKLACSFAYDIVKVTRIEESGCKVREIVIARFEKPVTA